MIKLSKLVTTAGEISGAAGSSIATLVIQRPVSDLALFPKVVASESADFSSVTTLDTLNDSGDRALCRAFTGSQWVAIPDSGLGTPFDNMEVAVDMSKFSDLAQPYWVKYCWATADDSESDWKGMAFPAATGADNSYVTRSEYNALLELLEGAGISTSALSGMGGNTN